MKLILVGDMQPRILDGVCFGMQYHVVETDGRPSLRRA